MVHASRNTSCDDGIQLCLKAEDIEGTTVFCKHLEIIRSRQNSDKMYNNFCNTHLQMDSEDDHSILLIETVLFRAKTTQKRFSHGVTANPTQINSYIFWQRNSIVLIHQRNNSHNMQCEQINPNEPVFFLHTSLHVNNKF